METKEKKKAAPQKGKRTSASDRSASAKKRNPVRKARPVPRTRKRPLPEKRKVARPKPEVVYTQPEPFNRNRFLLRLLTVAAVALALFFSLSIFFKVEKIMVSGAEKYTAWDVRQASGIEEGENLLALNEAMIGGRIKTALPYVSRVRVGIKLPDTVNIEIEELGVTYAVESVRDGWWLITSDGTVMESVYSPDAGDYTKILGIQLDAPAAGSHAVAFQAEPEETTGQTSEPEESTDAPAIAVTEPVTISAAEQLRTALDIVQYLEDNGILGTAREVDVSDMGQIQVWYGQQYQVLLGDATRLGYKIEMMKYTIDQLGAHYSGILDISYTLRPEEVVYSAFSEE